MEGLKLKCPLCCDKIFDSKELLLEHLTTILENVSCPICNNKWSSLVHLIEHLSIDNCQNSLSIKHDPHEPIDIVTPETTVTNIITENPNEQIDNQLSVINTLDAVENGEVSKMYVELLGKQLLKPCLQTQELKLIKHDGESHYVIITQPNVELNMENTVVTKQNNDGTISLTTMKDLKIESDTLIAPTETEQSSEDNQEELYSCNTCGVSFTSVLEHIQNYHNDQEVVVEEPIDEPETDLYYKLPAEDEVSDKQAARRVITDTGDIVEAPSVPKTSVQEATPVTTSIADKTTSQSNRVYATRFVQIDNLCDSVVKDIKESDDKNVNCHKVIVKELKTQIGPSVKMYHCTVCMIYVSNLNEFKTHPCKTLEYSCPHCPVVYGNSKSLHAHMKVHKQKPEGTPEQASYECAVCCTVFPTNKSLKLHKRMHDPLKVRPIELPVENQDGSEVTNSKYLCQICNKLIPTDYKTVHQNSHKSSNMFNCSICNKKFTSNEYLEMHMNVHNLDKVTVSKQDKSLPYNCLYCHRRFARPHEKVKHERIHTGEKPHSCEICGKSFRVSYCLTLHMRTHTGARPYACGHCGKRFKAHSVYNHHLLTHSDVRNYKCPYCPKAFKTSVQLAGHKNSHTKPFSCQHCNRPFASLYAVRVHTETHLRHNNLNFSCSLCGASYARAFALKDHVRHVHNQDVDAVDNVVTKDEAWAPKTTDNIESVSKELSSEWIRAHVDDNDMTCTRNRYRKRVRHITQN
ncbi:zinc finger protein 846 isoform X1 [Manduca sexta]|uniref:zinc finger protein 846 isoform X1 n=1 Tax=Manduca sexta TaxID=7130 RepID=UPI00188FE50E|nr:zinc finger protein 846 isoform X1 [Manduca sexta]